MSRIHATRVPAQVVQVEAIRYGADLLLVDVSVRVDKAITIPELAVPVGHRTDPLPAQSGRPVGGTCFESIVYRRSAPRRVAMGEPSAVVLIAPPTRLVCSFAPGNGAPRNLRICQICSPSPPPSLVVPAAQAIGVVGTFAPIDRTHSDRITRRHRGLLFSLPRGGPASRPAVPPVYRS